MSQVINFIKLDFNRSNNVTIPTIEWDQGSRFVRVQLQNNNQSVDVTGSQVVITVIRNDLEEVIESCNILNAKEGLIEFEISKAMVARQGDMLCQLKLSDNDSLLSSQLFKVSVNNTLMVSLEESRSEMDVLIHALGEVQDIDNRFAQTNAQLSQTNKNIVDMSVLKRDKDVLINMNDLSDDVRQAMTGGSVAVVGEASVTTNSIADNAIIYEKIKQSSRKGLSVMNVNNLLNNPLLDMELGGYHLDNCRLTSDYKIGGFNTLEIGNGTNTTSIAYQRNFNIQTTDTFNWLFTVNCENIVHIKPSIFGYKNNTFVKAFIAHQYVVNKTRDIKIEFTTDHTLCDEYRFVFEITTDDSVAPDKICWVGKQRVVHHSAEQYYSMHDEIYSLYGDLRLIKDNIDINPLHGKIVSFNGDSICYGDGYAGGYGKIIAERNNMIYENVAVNGSSITKGLTDSNGNPRNVLCESVSKMRSDADYVILEGGINDAFDWKSGKFTNIGSITQDYSIPLDTTTFCGALETYLKSAKERFNGKKIGYIIVHRMSGQSYPWGTQSKNSFTQIRDLIIQACNKYSIPYCDLFNQGLNTNLDYMRTAYTKNGDGVHPNKEGYERFYCDVIEAFMMSL